MNDIKKKVRYTDPMEHPLYGNEDFERKVQQALSLFADAQREMLLENGAEKQTRKNHIPAAYLQIRKLGYSFLITELNPDNPTKAYGLSSYGIDLRIGTIDLVELMDVVKKNDTAIESSKHFLGKHRLAVYAKVADEFGTIAVDDSDMGYGSIFEKFKDGKFSDPSLDLQQAKRVFIWP